MTSKTKWPTTTLGSLESLQHNVLVAPSLDILKFNHSRNLVLPLHFVRHADFVALQIVQLRVFPAPPAGKLSRREHASEHLMQVEPPTIAPTLGVVLPGDEATGVCWASTSAMLFGGVGVLAAAAAGAPMANVNRPSPPSDSVVCHVLVAPFKPSILVNGRLPARPPARLPWGLALPPDPRLPALLRARVKPRLTTGPIFMTPPESESTATDSRTRARSLC